MEAINNLWNSLVVINIERALFFLYEFLKSYNLADWGLTIILFTIIIKVITLPLNIRAFKSQRAMQAIQPQLKALQAKYKNDREEFAKQQMALYRENGVNPVGGCLPMLIQMPILIGLYSALFNIATCSADFVPAQFLTSCGEFTRPFLWVPDLSKPEPIPYFLAILSGITQWITQRMMTPPTTDPQQQMQNQIMQFMPLMFLFFAFQMPAGLVLYWVVTNVITIAQYGAMLPRYKDQNPAVAAGPRGDWLFRLSSGLLGKSEPASPSAAELPASRDGSGNGVTTTDPDGSNRSQSTRRRKGKRR